MKTSSKIKTGIAVAAVLGFAYAAFFPHKLEDAKVTATGTYQGSAYWSVGGVDIPLPFTEPKIYVDNHDKCLRGIIASELKQGDKISELVYTWGAWEECDYLKSYIKKQVKDEPIDDVVKKKQDLGKEISELLVQEFNQPNQLNQLNNQSQPNYDQEWRINLSKVRCCDLCKHSFYVTNSPTSSPVQKPSESYERKQTNQTNQSDGLSDWTVKRYFIGQMIKILVNEIKN